MATLKEKDQPSPTTTIATSSDDGKSIDSDFEQFYRPIESYEGYHRYDPKAVWTEQEEAKIVRKIDGRVMVWVCIMFFALQLDRGNISGALTDTFLADLKLTTNDYNNGQTIFYASFLFAELPSQLISKRLGPDRWLPVQMVLWSIVAASQCRLTGRTSFFITRSLLGICEGGFIPDVVLYLTYWYKSTELPVRLSFFWVALTTTTIVSSFMSFGILHLRGLHGWGGWRYLFLIEGILTGVIGLISAFYLPPSPTQTAGRFRGRKGWFTEREEIIMVNRCIREDPSKGDMNNRQAVSFFDILRAIGDYDLWPIYLMGLIVYIPMTPPTSYLTLTLRSLGFDTFTSNLLTIPSSVLFIINLLWLTKLSEVIKQRALIAMIASLWAMPLLVALEVLPGTVNRWIPYAITSLLVGYPYCHAILVGWVSRNSNTVRTRTVSAAFYNMTVQTGNIISSQIYRNDDKPNYRRGNKVLLAINAVSIVLFIFTKFYYVWRNQKRDKIWNAMTSEQKRNYLETTSDKGNKRLDFRFAH